MSISEVCTKLRKPGLQLSELCTLINTLGDCLTFEIVDGNQNVAQIKSGWEQLIEILIQTNHPTVRHITFQNIKYILNGRNGISEKKLILSEISNGVIKLLYHWNANIQLEIMEAILQDEYPIAKSKILPGQPNVLSSLINSDIEILNYLLSLMIQYNNCQLYFVVLKILKSFRLAIKDIHSKEAIKSIVDKLCQLEKNLSLNEIKKETESSKSSQDYFQKSSSYSKQEFLVIIFDIFDNIPNKFQDIKIVCYNMIKDELNLLFNEELLVKLNYYPYHTLIENGFKVITKISSSHPLVSHDHMKWMRTIWNLISFKVLGDNLNKYLERESMLLIILNQVIKSILTLYLDKGQILFIWNFELKENNINIEIDNNIITDETIFILNLDQLFQVFINFVVNFPKDSFCSNDQVCEYISNLSAIINIGLEFRNEKVFNTNKLCNKKLLIDLAFSIAHFLKEVKILELFQPFQKKNTKLLESYFLLNYILCKSYYILVIVCNDHQFQTKENSLVKELSSSFVEWVICKSSLQRDEFMKICSELILKLVYFDLAPTWVIKYNKNQRIGLIPTNNSEIVFLTILRNLYRFSLLDDIPVEYPINHDLNQEEISKLFSNFYYCCVYFHRLDSKAKGEVLTNIELQEKIEEMILSCLPNLNFTNVYKYAKYFAVIGRYKISTAIFESIKLYTLESCAWINILVHITKIYGSIQLFLRSEEASNNKVNSLSIQNLFIKLRSNLNNIESNFTFINNSNNCFFSSLYFSGISKITEFLIKSFNSGFYTESDKKIDHFEILIHLVGVLKTIFGLANIAKLISLQTFQIITQIYWSLKQIALKVILSQIKCIFDSLNTKYGSNNKEIVEKNLKLLKQILLCELGEKIPKFNILIEKSFIDNAIHLFKFLDFNSISQVEWQIVAKKVSSENLPNIFLHNLRKHPNDLLISVCKNSRKPGEKSSFLLIYLRNLVPGQGNTPSSSLSENHSKFPENVLSVDLQSQLWHNVSSDTLKYACMHVLKYVGRFPPVLLIQKMLPHVYLRGELLGFQNNKDCAGHPSGISSETLSLDNENQVVPVLKIYGFLKNGFQTNLSEECFWVRLKISYLFKEGEELLASHFLDLSVTEAHFSWAQPIERVPNAQHLKIVSVPLNRYKICIGIPYVLFINIL
ncbi:uncharacterized protein cubi_01931 [Cryptosporidium ubiquitum]|uniref:Uncharacterized protein n=1 Tax=Cryptosporidium ubiquitum TaxID=857276 RepID=A0A1J4MMB3_9CRYT|nr:uncharacterized protein cubi_01931 [Cryptosporidium ubiquitum]OII75410.1 hypothetical protein cubi_01931 [Cryptosporidium ubiquitum]